MKQSTKKNCIYKDIILKNSYRVDKTITIPAKAGFTNPSGTTKWKSATVIDYLESSDTYLVKWDDTEETSWLPRQYLNFLITYITLFFHFISNCVT